MHQVFATEGVVLGKRGVGEANNLVFILTREFGLVRVGARSSRVEHSKLRYGLETLTCARYSLVRGRYEWKLVGVEHTSRDFARASLGARLVMGRVTKLLLRLVHGEDPLPEVYDAVIRGFTYLSLVVHEDELEGVECVLVLRILSHLGYLAYGRGIASFIGTDDFTPELSREALAVRTTLIRTINESLGMTGL